MTMTFSLVFFFGVLVFLGVKFRALGIGMGVIAALFGFYLGDTGAAPVVNGLMSAFGEAIANIGN